MSSRMDRYINEENNTHINSRVNKNTSLYEDVKRSELSRVNNNSNIKIIEQEGKTIDLEKIRKYINEINEQPRAKRNILSLPKEEDTNTKEETVKEKVYDINSVLEKARKGREVEYVTERYKKIRNDEYDILNKIKKYESQEEIEEESIELNTEEKTIVNLINTVTVHKGDINLLEELMEGEGETTKPIKEEQESITFKEIINETKEEKEEEINKTKELVSLKEKMKDIDDSFYTSSISFNKEDFEGFEELEKSVKKGSIFKIILIIILVLSIIASLIIMANYVFELGLF